MAGGCRRLTSGDAFFWASTRSTASQQTCCRLEKHSRLASQKAFHCRAAEPAPAFHQSYFARSSADNRSASQTGSWIGTVLEAQRPQCRHHLAPTLETSSRPIALFRTLHPTAFPYSDCYSPCRPSTHCRRQGGCHLSAFSCHLGACSHTEEVRSIPVPRSDNLSPRSDKPAAHQPRATRADRAICNPMQRATLRAAGTA